MTLSDVLQVVVMLGVLYLAFVKSYVQEKGRNLATREDVAEITALVESVKSQLEYSLHAKLNLKSEEHDAIVDYFAKYQVWLSAVSNCSLVGVGYENFEQVEEIRKRFRMLQVDFDLAAAKMELFVENEQIAERHTALLLETLRFQGYAQESLFAFEKLYIQMKGVMSSPISEERVTKYRAMLGTETDQYQQFKKEQQKKFAALRPLVAQQRVALSAHLRALVNG